MSASSTRLSAADRMRFARQVSLDEIGEAGQLRLRSARVRVELARDSRSADVAALYLERAGVHVERSDELFGGKPVDVTIAAQRAPASVARAGDPRLLHAAAWLCGAFEAVETIKGILGVGVAARLPDGLVLAPEVAEQKS